MQAKEQFFAFRAPRRRTMYPSPDGREKKALRKLPLFFIQTTGNQKVSFSTEPPPFSRAVHHRENRLKMTLC
jgi:hypothetical protein